MMPCTLNCYIDMLNVSSCFCVRAEAVTQKGSAKKVFLKISQISHLC